MDRHFFQAPYLPHERRGGRMSLFPGEIPAPAMWHFCSIQRLPKLNFSKRKVFTGERLIESKVVIPTWNLPSLSRFLRGAVSHKFVWGSSVQNGNKSVLNAGILPFTAPVFMVSRPAIPIFGSHRINVGVFWRSLWAFNL